MAFWCPLLASENLQAIDGILWTFPRYGVWNMTMILTKLLPTWCENAFIFIVETVVEEIMTTLIF
jgi:hypothetical protein